MSSDRFDVVIIGGGPAGLAAGVAAVRRGMSHVVLERAELANTVHMYQRGKWVMAEPMRLPLHGDLPLRFEAGRREEVLARWSEDVGRAEVNLRHGAPHTVTRISGEKGSFRVELAGGETLEAGAVVLAIGLQGNLRRFGVAGDDLPHVTYQLDDAKAFEGKRIVVVGVGDAGIENALALAENENDVSIVNRRDFFDRAKAANVTALLNAVKAGRIRYYTNSVVDRFLPQGVVLRTDQGEVALEVDLVIGRLGANPPRDFLAPLGIEFASPDRNAFPVVSGTYETSVPGIHVIGALAGYPLIKNCINQGFEVIEHLCGREVTPADEPLLEKVFAPLRRPVREVLERLRSRVALFRTITPIQLRELLVDATVHTLAPGEVVFRRNDHSETFYVILRGEVEVRVPERERDADTDAVEEPSLRSVFLSAGECFGEGSLISGRRRYGTVTTRSECVLLELERAAMTRLINSAKAVRALLDRMFLGHKLHDLFPFLSPDDRDALAEASELMRYKKGEILFSEGDEPDGLHVIRRGAVSVSRAQGGREVILNHVAAGNYVGEIGLISRDGRRIATVRATVFTETIRLPAVTMKDFLARRPQLREEFEQSELDRRRDAIRVELQQPATDLLRWASNVGVPEATDLLVIDESLCIRCDNCEKACANTHGGVSRLDREGGPYFGTIHIPTACQHCENPSCMDDCPPDALRRKPTGEVYILDNCIGCGNCASNCPYGVIQMAEVEERGRRNVLWGLLFGGRDSTRTQREGSGAPKLAVKCDSCVKLSGKAACVASCPTGAIKRVRPQAWVEELRSHSG